MKPEDLVRPGFDFDLTYINWNSIESLDEIEGLLIIEFDFETFIYEDE